LRSPFLSPLSTPSPLLSFIMASAEIKKSLGEKLLGQKGAEHAIDEFAGKTIALYFSAHWCPPCRAFTPVLAAAYKDAIAAGYPVDLVFVSSDSDLKSFQEYFGEQPWKAIPYADEDRRQALGETFGVRGIPALIVIGPDGKIITKEGRADITKSKEKAFEAWAKTATGGK